MSLSYLTEQKIETTVCTGFKVFAVVNVQTALLWI
jgi:hypothetical protein